MKNFRCRLGSAPPPAKKSAGQFEKETLKKRITNIEQGITNIEYRSKAFYHYYF